MNLDSCGDTRFVLIDDDPIYCQAMAQLAKNKNIKMDVFNSLLDMGYIGQLGQYDVALLDYDLGTMNGVEIAQYMGTLLGDIPTILVSNSVRAPSENDRWPESIRDFALKEHGYEKVFEKALAAASRGRR